ncbi:MAG: acyl-CoA thioesterase [Hyphomicrobiales bacterium]|nr:acyl-CoA thioesterase [Hyphomicrobiales bacterium]
MSKPIEPFVHDIRVGWADCDPAMIAFTGRIPYFALESIDAWWEYFVGVNWYELNLDRDIGTPFVHMSLDFRTPVTPRHKLKCQVKLLKVGKSSLRFSVRGSQNGILCFEGEFVTVTVVAKTMRSQPSPPDLREILDLLVTVDE